MESAQSREQELIRNTEYRTAGCKFENDITGEALKISAAIKEDDDLNNMLGISTLHRALSQRQPGDGRQYHSPLERRNRR